MIISSLRFFLFGGYNLRRERLFVLCFGVCFFGELTSWAKSSWKTAWPSFEGFPGQFWIQIFILQAMLLRFLSCPGTAAKQAKNHSLRTWTSGFEFVATARMRQIWEQQKKCQCDVTMLIPKAKI